MPPTASRPLTDRQRDVMELIDRRMPIKVIAQELDLSESRVNQHIRALKDIYAAGNLSELVGRYRADQAIFAKQQQTQSNSLPANASAADLTAELTSEAAGEQAPPARRNYSDGLPSGFQGEHASMPRTGSVLFISLALLAVIALIIWVMAPSSGTIGDSIGQQAIDPSDQQADDLSDQQADDLSDQQESGS
ncbi:MAG: LuxR C-terminal-related transcriptional regulator [Erythrobacter sp.]